MGTISNGASATVTIQVTAGGAGFITNTAIATTASADLYLAGSTSIITTPVIQGLAPAAVSAALLSGGTLQLNVNGSAGQSYSLQSSTNLFSWKTVDISIGSFTTNVNTANAPQMFYRVIPTP